MSPINLELIQPLDILLYKGKTFSSWLIQLGTLSAYNHVAVVTNPKEKRAIESNTGHESGVREINLTSLQTEVAIFRVKSEHTVDQPKVISFLQNHLGAPFDYAGVTWLGVLKLVNIFSLNLLKPHNQFQRDKDYFCSELCYEAFLSGGLDIVPQISAASITSPGDIARSPVLHQLEISTTNEQGSLSPIPNPSR